MRTELETHDPAQAWAFLEAVFGAELRVSSDVGSVRCVHQDLGDVFVDRLDYGVQLHAVNDAFPKFTVVEVLEGWTEFEVDGARHRVHAGEVLPITGPGHPFRAATSTTCSQRVVGVSAGAMARATRDRGGLRTSVRPGAAAPLSGAAAAPWRALGDYLTQTERAHPSTFTSPLAASAAAGLVAHTALSLFANETWDEPTETDQGRDGLDGRERAVRRAIAFIEEAADTDIVLSDIAAAAHVTPRAIQYGFRRMLDTTPMAYLRRVRLQHVRAELVASPAGTTVAEVAGRWGFFHLGRFAAYYRAEFGENPARTLGA